MAMRRGVNRLKVFCQLCMNYIDLIRPTLLKQIPHSANSRYHVRRIML